MILDKFETKRHIYFIAKRNNYYVTGIHLKANGKIDIECGTYHTDKERAYKIFNDSMDTHKQVIIGQQQLVL